jgi:hypothetical protein
MFNKPSLANPNQDKRLLAVTRTGDYCQPVRLYYRISKQKTVLGAFKKIRCIYYEKPLKRWRWMYDHEAKKIRFDIPYSKIPKEYRPVILGDFFFPSETEMVVDCRSFQRATEAIVFLDRRINRRVASLERIRIVNQFFNANDPETVDLLSPPYDHFFENRDDIYIPDVAKLEADLMTITQQYDDPDEKNVALTQYLEDNTPEKSPPIEELPANFYEDGIASLNMALIMRMMETLAHWNGNSEFTKMDALEQFSGWMSEDDEDEEFEDDDIETEPDAAIASTVDVASEAVSEEE